MINPDAKLVADTFGEKIVRASTRDGFGTGTVEAGKADSNVVVLCADVSESARATVFKEQFPERFIEMGIAEQNMAATAAGLALAGKVPFMASYAAFSPGRNYEQIRTTIAINQANVKVCGMHAGVSVGPDGATHQMLEDIGLMRMLPGMVVINPGDAEEARKAVVAAATHVGPVYLRFGRSNTPVFTTKDTPFSIGKALTLWESERPRIALVGTGSMSYSALVAARALEAEGIGSIVLHVPTIKPLDEETLLAVAKQVVAVVTIEEHQAMGGFGSAVTEYLSSTHPIRVERVGIEDQFGQSGEPSELIEHYGLGVAHLVGVAKRALGAL